MQIKSKMKRSFIANILLGFVPEIVTAAIIAAFIDDGIENFFIVLLAMYAVYFLIWVKETIWEWILFVKQRKILSDQYLELFKKNNYPEPDDYIDTGSDWLLGIAENQKYPANLRVTAAGESAVLATLRVQGNVQRFLRASMALDDAIEAYKKTFPPKNEEE